MKEEEEGENALWGRCSMGSWDVVTRCPQGRTPQRPVEISSRLITARCEELEGEILSNVDATPILL